MRPIPQGATRRTDARTARRACAHRGIGRSRGAAGTARLIGAIVAGGGSTRFGGEPKGLAAVDGTRIIDRVESALRGVTPDIIVIANDPPVRNALASPGRTIVGDTRTERGSLIGLYTALTAANDDVLVVAWDMPFVTTKLLALIAGRLTPPIHAAIPETGHGLEPLCAAYARAALPYVESAIGAGRMRLSDLADALPVVRRIGVSELTDAGDPERLFFNVNTPSDLETAERMARGG